MKLNLAIFFNLKKKEKAKNSQRKENGSGVNRCRHLDIGVVCQCEFSGFHSVQISARRVSLCETQIYK